MFFICNLLVKKAPGVNRELYYCLISVSYYAADTGNSPLNHWTPSCAIHMSIVSAANTTAVSSDSGFIASPDPGYTFSVLFERLFKIKYTSPKSIGG